MTKRIVRARMIICRLDGGLLHSSPDLGAGLLVDNNISQTADQFDIESKIMEGGKSATTRANCFTLMPW